MDRRKTCQSWFKKTFSLQGMRIVFINRVEKCVNKQRVNKPLPECRAGFNCIAITMWKNKLDQRHRRLNGWKKKYRIRIIQAPLHYYTTLHTYRFVLSSSSVMLKLVFFSQNAMQRKTKRTQAIIVHLHALPRIFQFYTVAL